MQMLRKEDAFHLDTYSKSACVRKRYYFKCGSCGETIKVVASKMAKHTGLCHTCNLNSRRLLPFEALHNSLVSRQSLKGFVDQPISRDELIDFTKIKECTYCRCPIEWKEFCSTGKLNLDRLDCKKGYCSGNLVVCCWPCNFFKQDTVTYEAMLEIGPILLKFGIKGRKNGVAKVPRNKLTSEQRAAITSNCVNARNKTGLKGVHWRKSNQKWCAQIRILGKNHSLGCFDAAEDAGRAFDKKAYELYGPAAGLNFPSEYQT